MEERRSNDLHIKAMMETWQKDHDSVTKIVEIMAQHVNNFKEHADEFKSHVKEDDTNFKRIDKTIYTATGIIVGVLFLIELSMKLFK